MRFMPWLVSTGLIVAGVIFAANATTFNGLSASYSTNWGNILVGTICIVLGAAFAFAIWNRDTSWAKGGPRHPLE
ncbi:MAG TPA: hypothetical protein VG406_22250 [Isosphaeraceae bacterium]|jgi:putative copper export protein|nr:hypothetical protein [Isosphaeraceae bacterium]